MRSFHSAWLARSQEPTFLVMSPEIGEKILALKDELSSTSR
jgi:hypothetical protein